MLKIRYLILVVIICISIIYVINIRTRDVSDSVTNPSFSIILNTDNNEEILSRAISSVLSQTFSSFELIVVDDASSDNTESVMEKYKKYEHVVYLRNKEKKGIGYSRNKALDIARGKYITILDARDLLYPTLLADTFQFLENNQDVDVTWSEAVYLNDNGTSGKRLVFSTNPVELLIENIIIYSGATFRKSFVDEHNIKYNEDFSSVFDYLFWIKCLLNNGKFMALEKNLVAVSDRKNVFYDDKDKDKQVVMNEIVKYIKPTENNFCSILEKLKEGIFSLFLKKDIIEVYSYRCNKNNKCIYFIHPDWKDNLCSTNGIKWCRSAFMDCGIVVDKNEEYIDFRWDKWGQEKFYKIIGFDEVYKLK